MVEREDRSRSAAQDPAPLPGPGTAGAAPAGDPAPETYAALLAELGGLLDAHEPHEVVVLLRAELERRELRAYSHGWRDAADHFEPAVEAARAASLRTLRLVGRARGRAAVIPFRSEGFDGEPHDAGRGGGLPPDGERRGDGVPDGGRSEGEELRRDRSPADRPQTDRSPADRPQTDRSPADRPQTDRSPADRPQTDRSPTGRPPADRHSGSAPRPSRPPRTGGGPEPALVLKSRNSRVPTIPTLPASRLRLPARPPAEGGGSATPDDGAR
ncbi:hypothetical protein [Streptomyces sp. NPDC045714]|uniref:hypothetical protein n=1 Tax=Streptomyces sp. NPDC045714 TaxID=3154913 RepID=UPI0033EE20B7